MVERYANKNGDSPIVRYEIGPDWIRVEYDDGRLYRYDRASSGSAHIRQMRRLAREGVGLSTYISRHVREHYAGRER